MLARDNETLRTLGENRTRDFPNTINIRRSNYWTRGSRVWFLPGAWKFPLSRASMISPPSKLKTFTGNVHVLLTSVSLKLIKNKNKIYLRNHEFLRKKTKWRVKGKWCRLILFSFYDPIFFHDPSLSESDFISFLCFYLIRVGPSRSDPDWRSELIRSDFCTCLFI